MDFIYSYTSPMGGITLASDGTHLTGLWFNGQKYFADSICGTPQKRYLPIFEQTIRWLDIYFGGQNPPFTPPLQMKTTPFRKQVWQILLTIPYGQTMTYSQIAVQVARQYGLKQMSAQAVGGAVGHNSIALIIPCHRVIGSNGSLTGYAGGLDKKTQLLRLEKAHLPISVL